MCGDALHTTLVRNQDCVVLQTLSSCKESRVGRIIEASTEGCDPTDDVGLYRSQTDHLPRLKGYVVCEPMARLSWLNVCTRSLGGMLLAIPFCAHTPDDTLNLLGS